MDTPITKIRETIRLLISHPEISIRQASIIIGLSRPSITKIKKICTGLTLSDDDVVNLSDSKLAEKLGFNKKDKTRTTKPYPDFEYIEKELSRSNVTLMLLWQEYKESNTDGISYPHFARVFKEWRKKHRISMKQIHLAGDKLFVDFCGQTVPIYSENQEVKFYAKIFVGVMGASQFTVVYAVESEKKKDWLLCHVKAFEQLGGVPNYVIPDNLKSAVTSNTSKHVEVNRSYSSLGEYYGCFILPARPLKPQDKSLAEIGVKLVQYQILAKYRNFKFYSLAEFNQKLLIEIEVFNAKYSKSLNGTRFDRFIEIDADALKVLPTEPYSLDDWEYDKKVPTNHHVVIDTNYYSVPFQYIGQRVDIRISINTVSVFHERELIANHKKSGKTRDTITAPSHMPVEHQYQLEHEPSRLLAWGKKIGECTYEVVRINLNERKDISNGIICVKFLKAWLFEHNDKELLENACRYALKLNSVTKQTLIPILQNKTFNSLTNQEIKKDKGIKKSHVNIRGSDYYAKGDNDDN